MTCKSNHITKKELIGIYFKNIIQFTVNHTLYQWRYTFGRCFIDENTMTFLLNVIICLITPIWLLVFPLVIGYRCFTVKNQYTRFYYKKTLLGWKEKWI